MAAAAAPKDKEGSKLPAIEKPHYGGLAVGYPHGKVPKDVILACHETSEIDISFPTVELAWTDILGSTFSLAFNSMLKNTNIIQDLTEFMSPKYTPRSKALRLEVFRDIQKYIRHDATNVTQLELPVSCNTALKYTADTLYTTEQVYRVGGLGNADDTLIAKAHQLIINYDEGERRPTPHASEWREFHADKLANNENKTNMWLIPGLPHKFTVLLSRQMFIGKGILDRYNHVHQNVHILNAFACLNQLMSSGEKISGPSPNDQIKAFTVVFESNGFLGDKVSYDVLAPNPYRDMLFVTAKAGIRPLAYVVLEYLPQKANL